MKDESNYDWFRHGITNYDVCCVLFFIHPWQSLDVEIKRDWTSSVDGYIPCPDCLVRLMEKENGKIELYN